MSAKVFLDTNARIDAAAGGEVHPGKLMKTGENLTRETFARSTQVVGEFIRDMQNPREMDPPLTDDEVDGWFEWLFAFPVISIDREIILNAALFHRRYQIDHSAGQILAAAHRFGAETLLTGPHPRSDLWLRALRKSTSIKLNRQRPKASHVHPRQR
jgi:predicted nucleic acid-binding protein